MYLREKILSVFDSERLVVPEAGIVEYQKDYDKRLTFSMYINPHEDFVAVDLLNQFLDTLIFTIGIKDTGRITCNENTFEVYKIGAAEPALIAFMNDLVFVKIPCKERDSVDKCDFTRWEFLEFFDEEQVVNEEQLEYKYFLRYLDGFELSIHINSGNGRVAIVFGQTEGKRPIFEVCLDGIAGVRLCSLKKGATGLQFYSNESPTNSPDSCKKPIFEIVLRPTVFVSMDL